MLSLTPLEPRDALSGATLDYPREAYLAASARYAPTYVAQPLPGDVPAARLASYDDDDPVVIPAWPAVADIPVQADPATPQADASQALAALQQIPRRERVALAGKGVSVLVFAGAGPTDLPQYAYLRALPTGLAGFGSDTYAGAVALYDPAARRAVVPQGQTHFVLHELGHAAEDALVTPAGEADYLARVYPALRDFYGPDTYFGANAREAFAETAARRWGGESVPAGARDYLDGVFAGALVG